MLPLDALWASHVATASLGGLDCLTSLACHACRLQQEVCAIICQASSPFADLAVLPALIPTPSPHPRLAQERACCAQAPYLGEFQRMVELQESARILADLAAHGSAESHHNELRVRSHLRQGATTCLPGHFAVDMCQDTTLLIPGPS